MGLGLMFQVPRGKVPAHGVIGRDLKFWFQRWRTTMARAPEAKGLRFGGLKIKTNGPVKICRVVATRRDIKTLKKIW